MKLSGLSGFTVVKNALSLDYAIKECVQSMLPVCNEVVVADMGSTDGTRRLIEEWAAKEPKLRMVDIRDWTWERASKTWWVSAMNEAREHLRYRHMLQLDADEVLSDDPDTIECVRHAVEHVNAFCFDRLNFARDAVSLIPEGECCGRWVCRIGPSHLWLPSDERHDRGEVHILDMSFIQPKAKIFHLGFLRHPDAFYAKARVVLGAFFGEFDQRLKATEESGLPPLSNFGWWNRLTKYEGYYPASVRAWMEERGYKVPPC